MKIKIYNVISMICRVMYEWTTETSSNPNGPCTRRGGCCYDKDTYYTSHRFGFTTSHVNDSFGFRPILYINV